MFEPIITKKMLARPIIKPKIKGGKKKFKSLEDLRIYNIQKFEISKSLRLGKMTLSEIPKKYRKFT